MRPLVIKPVLWGGLATSVLLGVYVLLVGLISGPSFLISQFLDYWYFLGALSLGFGFQVGMYAHLKKLIRDRAEGNAVLGVTGTTSTMAMISCCAHYLVNLAPFLGAMGIATLAAQYQTELFWWGIIMNLVGSMYIFSKILKVKNET